MEKATLVRGNKTYRFIDDGDEYIVIGEETAYRGNTRCIYAETFTEKEPANEFYKELKKQGYKRA